MRVDLVPLWLAGVDTNRVNEEVRPKLKHFQHEVAKVLWEAFQEERLTADPLFDDLLQQDTPEVQAYKMIQGLLQLVCSQMLLKSRLDENEQCLEAIESQLAAPAHNISQSQAMQLSQAVKAVAFEYGKQTKRNEHPAVYGEMYRGFEITSNKSLPTARFQECMDWLTEWYIQLTGRRKTPF